MGPKNEVLDLVCNETSFQKKKKKSKRLLMRSVSGTKIKDTDQLLVNSVQSVSF